MQKENQDYAVTSDNEQQRKKVLLMATVPIGLLLNHAMGILTLYLKLPLYLDNIGMFLVTILVGVPAGVITGILSSLLGGLLINPVIPYYTASPIALALVAGWMAKKGYFRSIPRAIVTGILLGLVGATCNAPLVILFSGFTGTCTDATTALLLANGQSLFTSAFFANFVNDPFDKIIQCLLVVWMIRGFPKKLQIRFANSGYLMRNLIK
jgi:energy-coupling factor transport system substrate-specific component